LKQQDEETLEKDIITLRKKFEEGGNTLWENLKK
jgi:hypothetical protein